MRATHLLHGLLLIALLFAFGCSSNNKGKIEGTKWTGVTYKGAPLRKDAVTLEFRSDKKLIYRVEAQTYSGTYSLGMGDNVSFNLDQELAGRKNHVEKIRVNGNRLTMTDSDGTEVGFDRVQ